MQHDPTDIILFVSFLSFCYVVLSSPLTTTVSNVYGISSVFVNNSQVRLQTMPQPEPGQKPMFTGTLDCALKTVRKEVRL